MRLLIKIFKALSDETRLRIINILLERECCVYEVMQALDISQTRASRNLNLLYDAGILTLHRNGMWVYYSIDKDNMPAYFLPLIETFKRSMKNSSEAKTDRERLKTAGRKKTNKVNRGNLVNN
jgi:ArsR family transcriptional regulator, arsenate/arsenite/antimonite-responsive transcriptional repressor